MLTISINWFAASAFCRGFVIIGNVIGTAFFEGTRDEPATWKPRMGFDRLDRGRLLSLRGALTYAELTAMKPEAGGEYGFLREVTGGFRAFCSVDAMLSPTRSQAAAGMAFAIGLTFYRGGRLGGAVFLRRLSSKYR